MRDEAYLTYIAETKSWLHRGRKELICNILSRVSSPEKSTEILEVGAGAGQNIDALSGFGVVDALEINPEGISMLYNLPYIRKIIDKPIPSLLNDKYDIICAFDVIEHLEDDQKSVKWIFDSLKPNGIFIASVPAYQWLFSSHDIVLNHYRRYNSKSFRSLLPPNATVLFDGYFNTTLFPIAVLTRYISDLKNRFVSQKISEKQKVPQNVFFNKLFYRILKCEASCVAWKIRIPFGLTYYLSAQKSD